MKVCVFLSLLAILLLSSNGILAQSGPKHNKVVTCYVASWAIYRRGNGKFDISNIEPELCTHLIYTFAGLDSTTWAIKSLDPYLDVTRENYKKMTALRAQYPHLNILLSIGGYNEGSKKYSDLVSLPERRSTFVRSVVDFLKAYNFTGLDISWEYPGSRGGSVLDKLNFVRLLKELKEAFQESNYLLTAALGVGQDTIDAGYNIPELSKYLDYMHLMAYDYHGSWDRKVLPNSPLKAGDKLDVEDTLNYYLSRGAAANKLVLGLPSYGRTFVLTNILNSPEESPMNRTIVGNGFQGPYTLQDGFMGYNEICEELVNYGSSWVHGWDYGSATPYIVDEQFVITYDNAKSLKEKIEYAMSLNLAGVMVWSIDTDDFSGKCASLHDSLDPTSDRYPLLRSINVVLSEKD
ncbi:probable chitinase 2 [Bombus affinis]|uniref:probable chitinase 2 n=1 Tax=Bombus affinis TaxID=309941 RepID=UPI0021B7C23C|nr:probable chitinase 2 [Bombus affinis]